LQLLTLACCTGAPQKVGAPAILSVCTCDLIPADKKVFFGKAEEVDLHAKYDSSSTVSPCMPPYSHADIPFKFPHRNSGGPANA
jgi:hypothetical protein